MRLTVELKSQKIRILDLTEFGKGVAFVNGVNIGRFWDVGPTLSLYIPHSYLKEPVLNRIIIFETEGKYSEEIHLTHKPTFKTHKGGKLMTIVGSYRWTFDPWTGSQSLGWKAQYFTDYGRG